MEIERKYLVEFNKVNEILDLNKYEMVEIEQAYLSINKDKEIRVRKSGYKNQDSKCVMTLKTSGDLVREEVEFEIPHNAYLQLIEKKIYTGDVISKRRYKIPVDNGLVAELDVYKNQLHGLFTVEVEFKTLEQAEAFQKPYWFAKEVTSDKKYKNKNLAVSMAEAEQ